MQPCSGVSAERRILSGSMNGGALPRRRYTGHAKDVDQPGPAKGEMHFDRRASKPFVFPGDLV